MDLVIGGVFLIVGFVMGIILGVFFFGIGSKWVGDVVVMVVMLVGFVVMFWVVFGIEVVWIWYVLIGLFLIVLFGFVI